MNDLRGVDLVVAAWILCACGITVFMIRRGHRPATWALVSFVLGPLALVPAAWARFRSRRVETTTVRRGGQGGRSGGLSVLVGIDGSVHARRALVAALETLGDQIGRLTLATVLDYETARARTERIDRTRAEQALSEAVELVGELSDLEPDAVLLPGAPAHALVDRAEANGDDLIVVGTHGGGDSDWLLGNTAAMLSMQERVRVMIVPAGKPSTTPTTPSG